MVFSVLPHPLHRISFNLAATFLLLLTLTACGGDSGNNSGTSGVRTGILVDSPVVGIAYQTTTQRGTTGSGGEFKYLPGESITFSIGDITLPQAQAAPLITLLDLADTTSTSDTTVVNLARFLQTLDSTSSDNVVTIDANTSGKLTNLTSNTGLNSNVRFFIDTISFETEVSGILAHLGLATLVSETVAISHLEAELDKINSIVGTWITNSGTNTRVLVALDDNTWLYGECCDNPELERGSYVYQPDKGSITFNFDQDQLAGSGLDHQNRSSATVDINLVSTGNELTLSLTDGPLDMVKIINLPSSSNIVGSWGATTENSASIMIFTIAGVYFGLHDTDQTITGNSNIPDGIEFGQLPAGFTTADAFTLDFSNGFDSSGSSGLNNPASGGPVWNSAAISGINQNLQLSNAGTAECIEISPFTPVLADQISSTACP